MNEISSICKITDMFRPVAVAGKKQRQVVFAAAAENLKAVLSGIATIAMWGKRSFIDFKNRACFSCCPGEDIVIYRVMGVVAVAENFDAGIFHYIKKGFCILITCATAVIPGVHAGNCIIKFT